MTAAEIFIQNYIDESTGKSEIIYVDDLINTHGDMFKSNNGCQWGRKGRELDKKYQFVRYNAKEMGIPNVERF